MIDPIEELKVRATKLQRGLAAGDVAAKARLRGLAELAKADEATLVAMASAARRKHCLAIVAREHGFATWEQARAVLGADGPVADFGKLLYEPRGSGMLNVWFADYAEAKAHLDEQRRRGEERFLLAYGVHFFVADRHFVELLGWNADDPDWLHLGFDWVRPRDPRARHRLYGRRLAVSRGVA